MISIGNLIASWRRWHTIGVIEITGTFHNTRKPYAANYLLREDQYGARSIVLRTTPHDEHISLARHFANRRFYLLGIEPWRQGTIDTDALKKYLGEGLILVGAK